MDMQILKQSELKGTLWLKYIKERYWNINLTKQWSLESFYIKERNINLIVKHGLGSIYWVIGLTGSLVVVH